MRTFKVGDWIRWHPSSWPNSTPPVFGVITDLVEERKSNPEFNIFNVKRDDITTWSQDVYVFQRDITHVTVEYSPEQNGDTDDDI